MRDYSIEEEKQADARYFAGCFEKLQEATLDCFNYVDSVTFNYEILTSLETIQQEIDKINRELEYTDDQRRIDYDLNKEGL